MKRRVFTLYISLSVITLFLLYIIIDILISKAGTLSLLHRVAISSTTFIFLLSWFIFVYFGIKKNKNRKEEIRKAFDFYVEQHISKIGVGLLIFSKEGFVIWTSDFIEERFGSKIIGTKLEKISKEFIDNFLEGLETFRFSHNNVVYEATVNASSRFVSLKDVTIEQHITSAFNNEKLVIAELEIDNFQQLQSSLTEDELFASQNVVIKVLDDLTNKHNIFYRQYVNGKFLILLNQSSLNEFQKNEFDFLNIIRESDVLKERTLTVSLGIGAGTIYHKDLVELAKEGLVQSQSRGGDQIAVTYEGEKSKYFGSITEITKPISRVKVKKLTSLIHNLMSTKKIKTVFLHGHINADLDAVGAMFGIYELLKIFDDKDIYFVNQTIDDTTRRQIDELVPVEIKDKFISSKKANTMINKNSALFVLDVPNFERTENPIGFQNAKKEHIFIIDHHRAIELPKMVPLDNIYVDTASSSTCEIVTEMLFCSNRIYKLEKYSAQMMLNGIYLDTQQFRKFVSSRTFDAAAWLEKQGAKSSYAAASLKIPSPQMKMVNHIIQNIKEIKEGYFLVVFDEYEVPTDAISVAADEILRAQGRKASFVIAREVGANGNYKLSARGIGINVQLIAEALGGGGHFESAAAYSEGPIEIFEEAVVNEIVSKR